MKSIKYKNIKIFIISNKNTHLVIYYNKLIKVSIKSKINPLNNIYKIIDLIRVNIYTNNDYFSKLFQYSNELL